MVIEFPPVAPLPPVCRKTGQPHSLKEGTPLAVWFADCETLVEASVWPTTPPFVVESPDEDSQRPAGLIEPSPADVGFTGTDLSSGMLRMRRERGLKPESKLVRTGNNFGQKPTPVWHYEGGYGGLKHGVDVKHTFEEKQLAEFDRVMKNRDGWQKQRLGFLTDIAEARKFYVKTIRDSRRLRTKQWNFPKSKRKKSE